jgi:hypothetical protein
MRSSLLNRTGFSKGLGLLLLLVSCAETEYRFEQIDADEPQNLPLKFDGLYGVRDGAMVRVEGRFVDGDDFVELNFVVFLRPPAEFQSGEFRSSIGGRAASGVVECPSLTFQGNQTALPIVGGLFILKDGNNQPIYRVRIPPTKLTGRRSP